MGSLMQAKLPSSKKAKSLLSSTRPPKRKRKRRQQGVAAAAPPDYARRHAGIAADESAAGFRPALLPDPLMSRGGPVRTGKTGEADARRALWAATNKAVGLLAARRRQQHQQQRQQQRQRRWPAGPTDLKGTGHQQARVRGSGTAVALIEAIPTWDRGDAHAQRLID